MAENDSAVVLVVDDNEAYVEAQTSWLSERYEVREAYTGESQTRTALEPSSKGLSSLSATFRQEPLMSDKPASMYRDIDKPAYTRREYITGIPGSKIAQYQMGDKEADSEDYPVQISLVVEESVQIRHGSLEASRLSANRHLIKELGEGNYKMLLRKFPHQVIRENKQATGAGADRVSDGMRQSFGKIVGTAARIQAGERLFTAWCDVDQAAAVKEAYRRAYNKITPPCRIKVERGEELLIA